MIKRVCRHLTGFMTIGQIDQMILIIGTIAKCLLEALPFGGIGRR
jgi:hypothetical protein